MIHLKTCSLGAVRIAVALGLVGVVSLAAVARPPKMARRPARLGAKPPTSVSRYVPQAERRAAAKRPGHFIKSLPRGHVVLTTGEVSYYRHRDVYYRRVQRDGRWGYVVVRPPVGLVQNELPPGAERTVINGQVYYRQATVFYAELPPQPGMSAAGPVARYAVVPPPIGARLAELPAGARQVAVGETVYYTYGSSYLQPIEAGGTPQYVVVAPPETTRKQ